MSHFSGKDARPIFEKRTEDGRVMAVYADGRSEGFPDEYCITINRAPMFAREWMAVRREETAEPSYSAPESLDGMLAAYEALYCHDEGTSLSWPGLSRFLDTDTMAEPALHEESK